jgi:hypothetical protein
MELQQIQYDGIQLIQFNYKSNIRKLLSRVHNFYLMINHQHTAKTGEHPHRKPERIF